MREMDYHSNEMKGLMSLYRIGLPDHAWSRYVAALQWNYPDIIAIPF